MRGGRVVLSGMGGELGSLVATMLEAEPWVSRIVGLDLDPPRRRLRRSEFHLAHPTDDERIRRIVSSADPHVVIHLGVYEPNARASAGEAAEWTPASTASVFAAAAEASSLTAVVVRSGIEIYGRRCGDRRVSVETDAPDPTSPFGHQLADVEARASMLGAARDVPVGLMRLAPVLGPHVPSPLGRLLRLPSVPFHLLHNPEFSVIDDRDAARALVAAATQRYAGTLNVIAPGSISAFAAARHGRRLPLPLVGPQWTVARPITRLLGAPIPAHVQELLSHGRLADGSQLGTQLGIAPRWSTPEVIAALHAWDAVTYIQPGSAA